MFVVTLGPPLLANFGFALLDVPGAPIPLLLVRVLASGLVLSVLYGAVGIAGASLTDRRAFASAGVFIALIGLAIVAQVLTSALDLPAWVGMLDVASVGAELVARIHGETGDLDEVGSAALVVGGAVWVAGLAALVHLRYRRLAVVR